MRAATVLFLLCLPSCVRPAPVLVRDVTLHYPESRGYFSPVAYKNSPALDTGKWSLLCENDSVALFCGQGRRGREMRCAAKRDGRFFYIYGRFCKEVQCYPDGC